MTTAVESRPISVPSRWGELLLHGLVIAAIIVSQVIYTPAHAPSADATWHYRLALDILQGRPIWWFGVDANRFFPDLLFTLLGLLLSGGARFTTWLVYFYSIQFIAAYLALCGLAAALYDGPRQRLAFGILGIAGLSLLTLVSPFWCGWFLEPGGHGTGLSACIGLLALALWINKAGGLNWPALAAFVVGSALLVASNRFMLVGFFVPLAVALAAGAAWRRVGAPKHGAAVRSPLFVLVGCTALAGLAGLLLWHLLGTLSWYRMTAGGSFPDLPSVSSLGRWLSARVNKEWADLARDDGETRQIRPTVAILVALVPAALFDALRLARVRQRASIDENRLMFAAFTAFSVLGGLFFVFVMAVETGPYHYRYLTIPFGLALAYLAALVVPFGAALGRFEAAAAVALLAGVVGVSVYRLDERAGEINANRVLEERAGALERALRRHSSAPVMRGFAEYWEAHDLTLRAEDVHMVNVEVDRLRFGRYNSNANELCHDDFFFVLWNARENQPKREAIVNTLGEPAEIETLDLGRYPQVEIFFYDPKVLQRKLVDPSIAAVRELYPAFKCP